MPLRLPSRISSGLRLGFVFIAAIFIGLAVFRIVNALVPGATPRMVPPSERKTLTVSMDTLDGKHWSLVEQKGKVVLMNYFATWCPPCRAEMPDFKMLQGEMKERGVVFAVVSVDKDADRNRSRKDVLAEFNADEKLPFPILLPGEESPLLREQFPIPQTFLIDKQGRIAIHLYGAQSKESLRPLIEQLLGEP